MGKREYLTYRAVISIQFDCKNGTDPDETANEIVKDMISDGYPVILDDIRTHDDRDFTKYSYFCFVRDSLECGHGQKFKATFCCRHDGGDQFCIESVDVSAGLDNAPEYEIGGVGGELTMQCPRNSDGSFNFEQMCRDWIGVWHRRFYGACEDSIHGLYLMIKQVVSEGQFIK